LITELGKDCLLVYPPLPVLNANSAVDSVGQKPGNTWTTGAPIAGRDLAFPQAGGSGYAAQETTDTVKMGVAWDLKSFWIKPAPGVVLPEGTIQTKFYLTDLPKVMKAREMILQPSVQSKIRWRFVLDSEPRDLSNIIQGRYLIANWKRAG